MMMLEVILSALMMMVFNHLPLEHRAFALVQQEEHDNRILVASLKWGVDPFLVKGLLWAESGLDETQVNKKSGCSGIAQFCKSGIRGVNSLRKRRCKVFPIPSLQDVDGEPSLHKEDISISCGQFTRKKTFDPSEAISASVELLSYLVYRYGTVVGVESYNGGKNKKHFARRVFRRTSHYRVESGLHPATKIHRRKVMVRQPNS